MSAPPQPSNEASRLATLARTGLLGSAPDPAFDDLAELAALVCGAPLAAVHLIAADRQWAKSRFGDLPVEVARSHAICAHAILEPDLLVVPDAREDPRFAASPFVTGAPGLRFYAGAPLLMRDGSALGALCVMATAPRELGAQQRRALVALARQVVTQIELHEAREQAQKAALEAQTRGVSPLMRLTQTALEASASGMVLVDDLGAIVLVNSEIERLFGYPRDELLGRTVEILVPIRARAHHPELRGSFRQNAQRRAMGSGRDLSGRRRDGSEFPLEIGLTPIGTPSGEMTLATVVDLSARRASEAKILEQARALASTNALQTAILGSANVAIVATELDGTVRSFNAWAERSLGYAREEIVGAASFTLFHDPDELEVRAQELSQALGQRVAPDFEALVANARHGQADTRQWTHVRKDGTRFPVVLSVTALRDPAGIVVGFLGVSHDVSHLHAVEKLKNDFVSVVSHELRTPLTSIRGSLRLLESEVKGKLPAAARPLVEIASSNTERLIRLVNDILDVEKIEAGKLALKLVPLDLAELVASALQDLRGLEGAGVVPPAEVEPGLELWGDRDRLTQVIVNLVSNAVKFSPAGAPVRVSGARTSSLGEPRVRVCVSDRGPGVRESDRAKLFGKFQQLDTGDDRPRGGTGLGLAISRAIVTEHGGTIGVFSREGGGSTFWFELPAGDGRAPGGAP